MKLPSWPKFDDDLIAASSRVLETGKVNYWTGNDGREFEREFAGYLGCRHAVALANGTVALDLALHVLGIGAGDEVIVTPRSFLASVSCVPLCGARPVFADVEPDGGNLTADTIAKVVTPKTKAVILVHLAGWPCEMDEIMQLARECRFHVIEDCAQAHGARYRGRRVGGIGDVGAWSFCQDKIITTGGEGGMLTTDDPDLWRRAWSFKDHGKDFDTVYHREHPQGFRWLHESFGTNWRLTEMQSAIGRVALAKLPGWLEVRQRNAKAYAETFARIPALRVIEPPAHSEHAYYRYFVYVRPEALKSSWDRDRIVQELCQRGVPGHVGTCSEIYLEKAFDGNGLRPETRLPVAKRLGEESLMFPVHPELSVEHVGWICGVMREVMMEAQR